MFDHKKMQDFTDKYLEWVQNKPVSSLTEKEIEQCYMTLIELIGYHNWLYYISSQPIIADGQYDMLYKYIVELEKAYPEIIRTDSPTQRLTNQLQDSFSQAQHIVPLLSLENSYNAQDLGDWNESLQKMIGKLQSASENDTDTQEHAEESSWIEETESTPSYSFICQPKYDGISVELVYEHGVLTKAITRGDGYVWEDITANARTIFSIPTILKAWESISILRVRGEIIMSKKSLERLNTERTANGETLFANVRNAASGSLRQLDTTVTAKRGLTCYVYEILDIQATSETFLSWIGFETDTQALQWLWTQWFLMHPWVKYADNIDEVIAICDSVTTKNYFDAEDIEFDGVVVKIHELGIRTQLGTTNHHPRWAMAYKFPTKQVVTRIVSVDYQVWRTWVITPTANLEPVELSGVVISRASLHNFDYISEKNIHIGDRVWLQRSGEVIPYVVATIPERRTGDETPIVVPATCPICDWQIEKGKSDIYVYCSNPQCPAKIKGQLLYFASRDALNIEGLWDSLVDVLVDQKLVHSIADLYTLDDPQKRLQLLATQWIGQKKYFELTEELKKSKSAPLWRLINGLGITHIGKKTAQIIIEALGEQLTDKQKELFDIYQLEEFLCNEEFLTHIKGIWPEIIQAVYTWFQNPDNKTILESMAARGVARNIFDTKNIIKGKLTGIRFCITGTFALPRKVLNDILTKHGAVVSDALTAQTSFLIVWDDPSSKVTKAQNSNIPLIEWLDRLEQKFDFLKTDIGSMKLFAKETKKPDVPKQEWLFG